MRNLSLALLLIAAAPLAHAADGTIEFKGKVTDQSCTITTPGGKDFTVTLPTVAKSTLSANTAVAGRTPFSISLSGCKAGNVATYFEPGTTVDFGTGRLKNLAANAAQNVQLQLLGDTGNVIAIKAVGDNQPQPNSQSVVVDSNGIANLNYYVEYYATGAATAGDVTGSIKYTLTYN